MRLSELESRRVGILGMGREGRSVAGVLASQVSKLELICFDDHQGNDYPGLDQAWQQDPPLDLVIKSPGIPPGHPAVRALQSAGVKMTSATNLFFAQLAARHPEVRSVVVTGTKGKSTTAAMLHHVLLAQGLDVALGGNIGKPLTDLLPMPPQYVVAELSSYQLADFSGTADLAVVLNLYQEHLDWHGGIDAYQRDKMSWLTRGQAGQVLLDTEDPSLARWAARISGARSFVGSGLQLDDQGIYLHQGQHQAELLLPARQAPVKGQHNLRNLCAVICAAEYLGVSPQDSVAALASFSPLPHRLQELGTRNGVLWVNDSISTTPQSSLAAVQSYSGRPCILILGGQDRGLDWQGFAKALAKTVDGLQLILMAETGKRLAQEFADQLPWVQVENLAQAVTRAEALAKTGDVVLLSPGAPSYGAFANFEERGHAFARLAGFVEMD